MEGNAPTSDSEHGDKCEVAEQQGGEEVGIASQDLLVLRNHTAHETDS